MPNNNYSRYTVTSALPYANGPVHIGHLAGVYIPADIYVRYLRNIGKDVAFIGGSDEHGVPVTLRAREEGITVQEVVDKYHDLIKSSFEEFGISFDVYSRTSSEAHHQTASAFFKKIYDKGIFEEKVSEQFFDEANNQFLADRYIKGTCPNCSYAEAYGDQCESCGTSLSPHDLKDIKSTISGEKPVLKETKHWYLPLNKYESFLKDWILNQHKEWKPNVYGQCKSWLDLGLQPRAVTRDLDWGVPVPVEDANGKVLYVWFDAPIGYITATKEWAEQQEKDWEPYWKSEDTRLIHFIGKDNIVFHCIIFPAILKAHEGYILPDNVPANEFLNLEGNKISTSRNWAVWLHEYLKEFPDKQDVLRYVLCANAPETKDNDFTWKDFQAKNNNELVAILGNFVNRALVLTHKYYDGTVPQEGKQYAIDEELIKEIERAPAKISDALEQFKFRDALSAMIGLARAGNKYLADTEPWKLIKENPSRVNTILNLSLQVVANLAILMEPFLPFSSKKLWGMLNSEVKNWNNAGDTGLLKEGHLLNKVALLFEKIEDEDIQFQIDKLKSIKQENRINEEKQGDVANMKDQIDFNDFSKVDIRVGKIIKIEKIEKSKKLLKLLVDTGVGHRTILSGIAQFFEPEELLGKQVMVLINLTPRKMMGIDSEGMILMAQDTNGNLVLTSPLQEVTNGSVVA